MDEPACEFILKRDGHSDLRAFERSGHLDHTRRDIAKHFGLEIKSVKLWCGRHELCYYSNFFMVTADASESGICDIMVDGDEVQLTQTASSVSELIVPRSRNVLAKIDNLPCLPAFEDANMESVYMFLRWKVRPDKSSVQFKTWKQFCTRRYMVINDDLFCRKEVDRPYKSIARRRLAKEEPNRLVVRTTSDMRARVEAYHDRCHDGVERARMALGNCFKFNGMKTIIAEVLRGCKICAQTEYSKPATCTAIITTRPLELVMFDLFTMPMLTPDGYKYVLLVKDHFTKFHWKQAFKTKEMEGIAQFMYDTFKDQGVPLRWHCDNGSEFCNQCMDRAIELLGGSEYTHGRPRHPQTQGLIERANATVKTKVLKKCQQNGYLVPTETFEWRPYLELVVDNENNVPLKLYNGVSAFMCFRGQSRMTSEYQPSHADVQELHEFMTQCQLAQAGKRNQFPELDSFAIGEVVNVRATPEELKQSCATFQWSARGVIDKKGVSCYYRVRWLSIGLSKGAGRKEVANHPGGLSRYFMHTSLKRVPGENVQRVYASEYGNLIITDLFDDGECNYVYLDGDYPGILYSTLLTELTSFQSQTYAEWRDNADKLEVETSPAKSKKRNRRIPQSRQSSAKKKTNVGIFLPSPPREVELDELSPLKKTVPDDVPESQNELCEGGLSPESGFDEGAKGDDCASPETKDTSLETAPVSQNELVPTYSEADLVPESGFDKGSDDDECVPCSPLESLPVRVISTPVVDKRYPFSPQEFVFSPSPSSDIPCPSPSPEIPFPLRQPSPVRKLRPRNLLKRSVLYGSPPPVSQDSEKIFTPIASPKLRFPVSVLATPPPASQDTDRAFTTPNSSPFNIAMHTPGSQPRSGNFQIEEFVPSMSPTISAYFAHSPMSQDPYCRGGDWDWRANIPQCLQDHVQLWPAVELHHKMLRARDHLLSGLVFLFLTCFTYFFCRRFCSG